MRKLKMGWYWVKISDRFTDADEWEVAEWDGANWNVTCADHGWDMEAIDHVGPRIPTPDEPWQCVPSEATPDMLDIQTLGYHTPASKRWRETLAVAPKP